MISKFYKNFNRKLQSVDKILKALDKKLGEDHDFKI